MKKKIIIQILLISAFIIILQPMSVQADNPGEAIYGVLTDGFGYFMKDDTHMKIDIQLGKSETITYSNEIIGRIVGIVQVAGSLISVIALIIIGFRYMMSSVEEKAQLKNVIKYYIIGAVLVFATSNVLSVAYNVISGIDASPITQTQPVQPSTPNVREESVHPDGAPSGGRYTK